MAGHRFDSDWVHSIIRLGGWDTQPLDARVTLNNNVPGHNHLAMERNIE